MTSFLDEAQVELGLIELLRELGYQYAFEPNIACDGPLPERTIRIRVRVSPLWAGDSATWNVDPP